MKRPSGFTLVELMVVVAIIGILSSVAIPSLGRLQLRSKEAEKSLVVRQVATAVEEYFVRDGRYANFVAGPDNDSWMWGAPNPPGAPTPQKRLFLRNFTDWSKLSLRIDGALYYQYEVYAYTWRNQRYQFQWVNSDLDGDRVQRNWWQRVWYIGNSEQPRFESASGGEF